jgi:hypothetical protein
MSARICRCLNCATHQDGYIVWTASFVPDESSPPDARVIARNNNWSGDDYLNTFTFGRDEWNALEPYPPLKPAQQPASSDHQETV